MKEKLHRELSDIFKGEFYSLTLGIVAGVFLVAALDKILLIPGILVLLPGFMEMRGSISGAMSARLSSGLILGKIKPIWRKNSIIKNNIIASFGLALIDSAILGIVAWAITWLIFGVSSTTVIVIALAAGIISNAIQVPFAIYLTFWFFKRGHDPNDVMGPWITTIGDIISTMTLFILVIFV